MWDGQRRWIRSADADVVDPPPELHDDTARTPPAGRQAAPSPVPVQGHLALGELDGGGVAQLPTAVQLAREIPAVAERADGRGPRGSR